MAVWKIVQSVASKMLNNSGKNYYKNHPLMIFFVSIFFSLFACRSCLNVLWCWNCLFQMAPDFILLYMYNNLNIFMIEYIIIKYTHFNYMCIVILIYLMYVPDAQHYFTAKQWKIIFLLWEFPYWRLFSFSNYRK